MGIQKERVLMKLKNLQKKVLFIAIGATLIFPSLTSAATSEDLDALIQNQQMLLQQLNDKKTKTQADSISAQITALENQIAELKNQKQYDAQGAINALAEQLNGFKEQLAMQTDAQTKIVEELKTLETKQNSMQNMQGDDGDYHGSAATIKYLVNPGPTETVSYTQDAINSQGNSTMIFAYTPNQLYKIYCRTGYLTDLEFKKGEKVTFVGGGDTSAWGLNSAEVDGVPHIYIKPVVSTSATNIIVNTTKHSYHILLNTSDWYNPMIRWSYGAEEMNDNLLQQKKDEKTVTGLLNVSNPEQLNFNYEILGDSDNKPVMVFDDGSKTYIKFKKMTKKMPVLFTKEKGKKEVSLVNYKVKDNYYIVDRLFSEAQLRISDKEMITIKSKE